MSTSLTARRAWMRGWKLGLAPATILAALVLAGCPPIVDDYEAGFEVGYAEDEWYFEGYDDSLATVGFGPIFYEGDEIPNPQSPEYDRGYWDGVWTAYNDGYFAAYDEGFTEGFRDGYLTTFGDPEFLLTDQHIEYGTGGWEDGYEDGFSEGRVFGAYDYLDELPSDWEDALADYREGTDLCVYDVCTGIDGPVILYEWGTTPPYAKKATETAKRVEREDAPAIRRPSEAASTAMKRTRG